MSEKRLLEIQQIRHITQTVFTIRLDRNDIQFKAGQHIGLGVKEYPYIREYSIYSGEDDNFLEVLIKEVKEGTLTPRFKACSVGEQLNMDGPSGSFVLDRDSLKNKTFYFIATGTGISPFHCYIKTYQTINYQLIHGVKTIEESIDREEYEKGRYISCTTGDQTGEFNGRVGQYINANPVDPDGLYYLCGSGKMIYEVNSILQSKGIPPHQIFWEIYF
jgi:ferredoxin--NADP+ reductase/benzoate/toluate 1,2-dioxygenase reductase subunit